MTFKQTANIGTSYQFSPLPLILNEIINIKIFAKQMMLNKYKVLWLYPYAGHLHASCNGPIV